MHIVMYVCIYIYIYTYIYILALPDSGMRALRFRRLRIEFVRSDSILLM